MSNSYDNTWRQILPYLPFDIRELLDKCSEQHMERLEELRLQPETPVLCRFADGEAALCTDGSFSTVDAANVRLVSRADMRKIVLLLADSSLYALEEELRRGYITLPGGHRAGICGRAVLEHGHVRTLKDISSINIRLARSIQGNGGQLLPQLVDDMGNIWPTLIVSPPRAGKTTLLRDLARIISDGENVSPQRVAIADERSELAAMHNGVPQLPVGLRTDVMDGCPKAEAMMMLLRSMSPQVLVTDEIGRMEDAQAVAEAAHCGVSVIASAHGSSESELRLRPALEKLLDQRAFKRIVMLSRRQGPGTIERVYAL